MRFGLLRTFKRIISIPGRITKGFAKRQERAWTELLSWVVFAPHYQAISEVQEPDIMLEVSILDALESGVMESEVFYFYENNKIVFDEETELHKCKTRWVYIKEKRACRTALFLIAFYKHHGRPANELEKECYWFIENKDKLRGRLLEGKERPSWFARW